MTDDARTKKRLQELYDQSASSSVFLFTDFLSPADASLAYETGSEKYITGWGGSPHCERVMIRFGNADEFGYEMPFPIRILHITPLNKKFADKLTHRDFLGSLMNLGVERSVLGDIIVKENEAYVFVAERMSDYIKESLFKVKHTDISCDILDELPEYAGPVLKEESIIASSDRLDGIISKIFHLSRSASKEKFMKAEVFVNGKMCQNPAFIPKEGDTISLRHFGKCIFKGISHETKKGNVAMIIERYV